MEKRAEGQTFGTFGMSSLNLLEGQPQVEKIDSS